MPQDIDTHQLTALADTAWRWAELFLPRLAAAIIILVVGFAAARWVQRAVRRMLGDIHQLDPTLRPLLAAAARYAALIVALVAALSQLGISTASLLAVLGAAGLAIGLALQGTLSNIAAGMVLLWLRPFHLGDYIEVGGQGGTVEELGLFGCRLRTYDGLFLFLPNSAIWNAALKNHSRNASRLVSIGVGLPAAADLDRARTTLLGIAGRLPNILPAPEPQVFVETVAGGVLTLTLMLWTAAQYAGTVERRVVEEAKRALDALGDEMKPVQITRSVPADPDPSRYIERPAPAD